MMVLVTRLVTIIMITLSATIPLGIGRDETIFLVIGKLLVMLVLLLIVLMLMRMYVVVLRWGWLCKMVLSMIFWMVHLLVVVMTIAATVVDVPVWNSFVLCHVQPRHFFSV